MPMFTLKCYECGALKVLFPEIDAPFGVPQRPEYHPEIDCGIHTLMSLQQACKANYSLDVCFAVLVHDLGKALTPKDELPVISCMKNVDSARHRCM